MSYHELDTMDFSTALLSLKPHRLLVAPDTTSGWADLCAPDRVIDTLVRAVRNLPHRWAVANAFREALASVHYALVGDM